MEKISFRDPDTQETVEFFCLEQTKINNQTYLLVAEEEAGDSDSYILKEKAADGEVTVYEMVEEEAELSAIGKISSELLEEVEIRE